MNANKLNYLEIIPKHVKNILFLLHGYGTDAENILGLGLKFKDLLPYTAILSVNAPCICEANSNGYQWFSLKTMNLFSILKEIKFSYELLTDFIDEQLKRFNLNEGDIIICGFSQGAMMSLYTGLRRKSAPIALLSFSGMLPDTVGTLKKEIKSKPKVFLCHGTSDNVVPYSSLEKTENILREFDIKYESYSIQDMGHMIDEECIENARKFIKNL
jgi:phospholipase/carboxylesterase